MPRGQASQIGDTHVAANGYHYTRTDKGWKLTHHIIAEETLGRPISPDETVRFCDGDRTNLKPDNIFVTQRRASRASRIAALEAKIMELTNERDRLIELEKRAKRNLDS